ncbi:ABC transporter ATP-binding protein [Sporolactobacillus laevolacticus]|uniref:Spermidine/putrescine ABC transporter ATP-binding protein n=1 Tax=Sporolactobacillus laevolacticus DSM 442 TaxID=1395513 RepID=V6J6Q0_9BACL|nr:ABC transporter ATP-binding protein [Sporolactobacillus laevolacticus]EST12449.1 spermidine/putrescine ABC transporter ATP-binding protein [Sporolactobacillus laevolacticus DSM 442]
MIQLEGVTKRYLTKKALNGISLQIEPGHIVGLIGSNGSGKSTTLKLISGLLQPTKGTVLIDGEMANRRICRKIAYLSELDAYYSFFTVKQTVDFYEQTFSDFNREKAEEMLDFMKLDRTQNVKHLSKGNRGRLKIVVTLAREVPFILMDEPLSGLDPMVRSSIIKGLISFIDLEKQTVILTTHELQEIEPLLDEVILIKNGEILDQKSVEDIRSNENLSLVDWMVEKYDQ